MKKAILWALLVGVVQVGLSPLPGWAQEKPDADEIMRKVDEYIVPKDLTAEMTMNLIDRKGQVRQRMVRTFRMGDDKQIMWFLQPADVKGSSFLRLSYDDRDDDMWLYLPAFGKVRRIASHAKNGNFMGTDFTYEDLGDRKLKDYDYRWLKDETIGDKGCWVIESAPRKGISTDFARIVSWIWKDEPIAVQEEFYDASGTLRKKSARELTRIKSYWVPAKVTMHDLKLDHRTEMIFDKMTVDTGLSEKIFDSGSLTRIY